MTLLAVVCLTAQMLEHVVVNVNGDIVTRRELDERVRNVMAQEAGRPIGAAEIIADAALRAQAVALAPRVLADAIDELVVIQRARDLGLGVDDDEVARVIARMRLDNNIGSDQEFADLLRQQNIRAEALEESVAAQILIEKVRQELFRGISVSEQEARAYYRLQPDEFSVAPAVVFIELLVGLPPLEKVKAGTAAAREYDQGLLRLDAARQRITRGEDFGAVARAVSDALSKEEGGLVGPVVPEALPPAVRAVLAKLAIGQVSGPVRTDAGYWLLKLQSASPARYGTFETLRPVVLEQLLLRKQTAAFAEQVNRLRGRALLNWKDPRLKAAFEKGQR